MRIINDLETDWLCNERRKPPRPGEVRLTTWAERAGHTIVDVFEDQGISGAKGRDKRPAFDRLLKAAVRREVDMIAVWSSDRLGRSLSHLVEVLQTIRDTGTGLYIHTQAVDTTTPAGRALFGMLGVFAEFEREMLVARVNAGLARAKDALMRDGKFVSKAGRVRTSLGRPKIAAEVEARVRAELAKGTGIIATAKLFGLGNGTVHRIRREMTA